MHNMNMNLPSITSFTALVKKAQNKTAKKRLTPLVIGDCGAELNSAIAKAKDLELISEPLTIDAWDNAEAIIKEKKADFIIGSNYEPYQLLSHLNNLDDLFFDGSFLSHIGVLKTDKYPKLLFVTDGFVQKQLSLKAKMSLLQNAVSFARKLGVDTPKAAFLAAVEVVYPQMVSTTDAAVISKMVERKQIKGVEADGPLSFDIAIDQSAAEGKGITNSPVAGQADILVAPDIATANGIYKAAALLVKAEIGGIFFGGPLPVTVNLPTDKAENCFNSLLLGIMAAG